MITEKFLSITKLVLGLLVLLGAAGTSAVHASVNLSSFEVPKNGGWAYSQTFNVSGTGELKFAAKVAVKGFMGSGGNSEYQVQLLRGTTMVDSKTVVTNTQFKEVWLRFVLTSRSHTGTYRVRIRNTSNINPQAGTANFATFDPPTATAISGNLDRFGITQGNVLFREIDPKYEPDSIGSYILTATWGSTCNLDPAGCKLKFEILRNGAVVATKTGYTYTTPFAPTSQKMRIVHQVQQNQIGGNWRLRVTGSSIGDAANIIPKVQFNPACQ
ncbi:MAG: hypothetical protein IPM25_15560 [Chloracidobacterium sp.]|nr:hypothetical protein [Chloracidobacterium sp.]